MTIYAFITTLAMVGVITTREILAGKFSTLNKVYLFLLLFTINQEKGIFIIEFH